MNLSAGVKQGDILSPFLFVVFVDKLLDKLELSGLECYVAYTQVLLISDCFM